jgi:hypothetical protein
MASDKEDYGVFDTEPLIQGEVNIEGPALRGRVWSFSASAWRPGREDDDVEYDDNRNQFTWGAGAGSTQATVNVTLPNGAIISECVVYGTDTALTWTLYRDLITLGGSATVMASALIGTADTTITNATIDNALYSYWITVTGLTSDTLYGGKITFSF